MDIVTAPESPAGTHEGSGKVPSRSDQTNRPSAPGDACRGGAGSSPKRRQQPIFLRRPPPHPLSAKGVEREVGFALGRAYPWLTRVKHPTGAGVLWAMWPGEHGEAANDSGGLKRGMGGSVPNGGELR